MVTYLGSLVQSCCGEGGTLQTNITGVCGECSQCFSCTGFAPRSWRVYFHGLHFSGSRLLSRELSEADPELYALPRSKSLRFRFLGTPQRHRLSWACVLCPSQIRGAQMTRCLASALSPGWGCILSPPLSQLLGFLGAQQVHHLRCALCLFCGADLWLQSSRQMLAIQNPRSLG